MNSISYEEAAALGDPTLVDREVPHVPNHDYEINETCFRNTFDHSLKCIAQFNFHYPDKLVASMHYCLFDDMSSYDCQEKLIAVWHIKPKNN